MNRRPIPAVLAAVFAALASLALVMTAQEPKAKTAAKTHAAKAPAHIVMSPADLKWGDAPPAFPPGAQIAVLEGDPGQPGLFTLRLKVPDGYRVAPHWHPAAEHLTIISGTFHLGTGDKLDESKGAALPAGSYASMPAKMHHFAWVNGETVVQVHGMGPFKLIYVNPADAPKPAAK
jgi:Domain of unknown function (DUF4437)